MDGNKPKIPPPSEITPSISKGESSIGDFIQKNPKIFYALLGIVGLIAVIIIISNLSSGDDITASVVVAA